MMTLKKTNIYSSMFFKTKLVVVLQAFYFFNACTHGKQKSDEELGEISYEAPKGSLNHFSVYRISTSRQKLNEAEKNSFLQIRNGHPQKLTRSFAALALGELTIAEKEARAFLRDNPDQTSALELLIATLAMQKKFFAATFYAKRLESKSNSSPLAPNVLGLSTLYYTRMRPEDFVTARKYFEEAISRDSREVASALNLGSLLLEQNNYEESARFFALAAERCNNCIDGLMGKGVAEYRNRRFNQAENTFETILKNDPPNAEARYRLALIAKEGSKDIKKSRKLLQEILNLPNVQSDQVIRQRSNSLLRSLEARNKYKGKIPENNSQEGESDPSDLTKDLKD